MGDPLVFTLVLFHTSFVFPDGAGNNRVDGFANLFSNPHVGLLYLVPGRPDTLRINGRTRLLRDAPFFDGMIVKGSRPRLALLVEIEEIFYHCPKAFLRSKLWDADTWDPRALPSTARIVKSVQADTEETVEELERHYAVGYTDRLYPQQ